MSSQFETKLTRLRAWMADHDYGTVVLSRLENLAWLGCGADLRVPVATELGCGSFVVTRERVTFVTTNIEVQRVADEELGGLPLAVEGAAWHEDGAAALQRRLSAPEGRLAADTPGGGRELVNLAPLRAPLLPEEIAAYRALGADHGAAMGQVAADLRPGETEFALAGRLAAALLARGITPTVLLVAADERLAAYRHPLPTAKAVQRVVLLVAAGRRRGLICSVSRMVHFGPPSDDLRARHAACCAVDAALIANTRPGAAVGAIFGAAQAAYAAGGYPEEWRYHHQGGPTGYVGREYRATAQTKDCVYPWQAFAWNPSIAGTKSEDTILAGPDGPEILSASPDWPLLEVEAFDRRVARPDILVR